MIPNLKLLDSFKLTGHLNVNFACELSSDDRIFVICESSLYVLTLRPDLRSTLPQYSYQKVVIEPSTYALCAHLDLDINSFIHDLPKDALYEATARMDLSHNLQSAAPFTISQIQAQWSESNMVDKAFSMLGVLTSLYTLDIYVRRTSEVGLTEYKSMLNLTKAILDRRKGEFVYSTKLPPIQKMRELKKRVEYISPITFTWGHTFQINGDNCTVVFIGHFKGEISIWKIHSVLACEQEINKEFLVRYSTKLGDISTLYWHRTEQFGGVLCAGDCSGKISVFRITNLEQQCCVDSEVQLYLDTDCKVDRIAVTSLGDSTILLAVKQSNLLFFGIDVMGNVFDLRVHNVGNFYITGITLQEATIKVLTFMGIFKLLKVSIQSGKILVSEQTIPIKHEFADSRTHGLIESNHKVFYGILTHPSHFKNAYQGKKFATFCFFHDINLNPLKLLLDNKSSSLRTFWDCLETLRLVCLKEQRFPWLGIKSDLDLDSCSVTELKTLRLIAKISESVFVIIKRVYSYDIKPYILLHYLVDIKVILQRLALLFAEKSNGKKLSVFQMQSIDLQVLYLKELVRNGVLLKAQVGKSFISELTHILSIANELEYPDMDRCNYCGEKLIGATCIPPHADSRCTFTLMPILLTPAFKCLLCNSLAHKNIENYVELVICPYCDYPMERICVEKTVTEIELTEITSECAYDCIQDISETLAELCRSLDNTEDSSEGIVYVSDDDVDCSEKEIKELYFKTRDMKLDFSESILNGNE